MQEQAIEMSDGDIINIITLYNSGQLFKGRT